MSNEIIYIGGKPEPVHKKSVYHRIEDCNYYAKRGIACPYCTIGSKPVHGSLIDEDGNWKFDSIEELE